MGVPSEYDHPALAIFDRTLVNLRYIQAQQETAYVFEFTALVNSLLGVLAHPWDQLLHQGKLEEIRLDDQRVSKWGFPICESSRPHTLGTPENMSPDQNPNPQNLGKMLRLLRNGIAHGNIEVLDLDAYNVRRVPKPIPVKYTNDIVALEVWNCLVGSHTRVWGTVLTNRELKKLITGMERLVQDREYWSKKALETTQGRKKAFKLALLDADSSFR
jgi:hypothetical protein